MSFFLGVANHDLSTVAFSASAFGVANKARFDPIREFERSRGDKSKRFPDMVVFFALDRVDNGFALELFMGVVSPARFWASFTPVLRSIFMLHTFVGFVSDGCGTIRSKT